MSRAVEITRLDLSFAELRKMAKKEKSPLVVRRMLAIAPSDPEANGVLADTLASRQAFADAVPHYRAYLAAHGSNGNEWTGLGIALVATGKPAEAVEAFRNAVAANASNAQFRINLARALLDQGDSGAALEEARRAATAVPDEPAAHDVLARAFATRGMLDFARREFQRALQLDPQYAPSVEGLKQLAGR